MTVEEAPRDFVDYAPADADHWVDMYSTWRDEEASTNVAGTMTAPGKYSEATTQTVSKGEMGVQTDEVALPAGESVKAITSDVAQFLANVEGMVGQELQRAVEEHEVLEPFTRAQDEVQEPATCIQYLSAFNNSTSGNDDMNLSATQKNKHKLVVTSVSWSSTGQTIAASYGRFDVVGWCTFPGVLVTWNLGREEINAGKPDVRIDTDTCLMSCAFHPAHPALIAGGTFNGELYVWDLSLENDMQRGRSDPLMDVRHTEPIVTMTWQYNLSDAAKYGTKDKSYRLVTLGADGRVMIWQWHKLDTPIYGYQLLWPQPGVERKFVWGGACMSFQREPRGLAAGSAGGEAAGTFLVGSEGGKIFKCYNDVNDLSAKDFAKALAAGDRSVELRCPIKETGYTPHAGSVFGLDCSPFQRELFLTCGTDGSVRMFSSLKKQPLLLLEPTNSYLYTVQWSPFRPTVFAVSAADGCVYMYDLLRSRDIVKPVLTLDTNGLHKPTYAMAFNPKKPDLMATGDTTGIQIWRLPSSLTDVRRGEDGFLKKMSTAEDVTELLMARE